jgi:hypothetical protein
MACRSLRRPHPLTRSRSRPRTNSRLPTSGSQLPRASLRVHDERLAPWGTRPMGCLRWPALLVELLHNTAHAAKGGLSWSSRAWTDNLTLSLNPARGVHRYQQGALSNFARPCSRGQTECKACQYRQRWHLAGQREPHSPSGSKGR